MPCTSSPQQIAQAQAAQIESYWAKHGRPDVRCMVVVEFDKKGRQVFGVRSNLRLDSRPTTTGARRS